MFLLGMNDGLLSRVTDSLLTPEERAQTQNDTRTFLGLTDESRALMARLDVKRAMTLPRRWLFLSSAKTAPDGTALRPLSLLGQLRAADDLRLDLVGDLQIDRHLRKLVDADFHVLLFSLSPAGRALTRSRRNLRWSRRGLSVRILPHNRVRCTVIFVHMT